MTRCLIIAISAAMAACATLPPPVVWCTPNEGRPICIVRSGERCAAYYCQDRQQCAVIVSGLDACEAGWIER